MISISQQRHRILVSAESSDRGTPEKPSSQVQKGPEIPSTSKSVSIIQTRSQKGITKSTRRSKYDRSSSLPRRVWHKNFLAGLYRRNTRRFYPNLIAQLKEFHDKQLFPPNPASETGNDSSDEDYVIPSKPLSDHDSESEASDLSLHPPSDNELFGLSSVGKRPTPPPSSPASSSTGSLSLEPFDPSDEESEISFPASFISSSSYQPSV